MYSTYINGIALGESYGDIETAFDVHSNVPYYLLYAIYSTGDSFHYEEGHVEFIDLYTQREVAEENMKRIEAHAELYKLCNSRNYGEKLTREQREQCKKFNAYSVVLLFETQDGATIEHKIHVPWNGYFERLSHVTIEGVHLLRGHNK